MPSEFHNREPPLPFGNPKSRLWYCMDIFWNRPMQLTTSRVLLVSCQCGGSNAVSLHLYVLSTAFPVGLSLRLAFGSAIYAHSSPPFIFH